MKHRIFFLLLTVFLLSVKISHAAPQAVDFTDLLSEAGNLARQGEWDRSEVVFLKAAESPTPDDRVKAYEGLTNLYTRLKLYKKASHAEKRLREEKKFLEKLVPKDKKYYESYQLVSGDTYAKIASREKVSMKWLQKANGNKPLIEGQTIQVPKASYKLIVRKASKKMEWRRGDEILKIYPISVGRKGMETPEGKFKIVSKVKNPTWYWLKKQIPPDSPENLLGPRWLGIDHKGHGIHGTRDPKSIGNALSHGCVRMFNRDVEELFDWVPVGTAVTIQAK